jgi:twitching motility protein PilT
VNTLKQLDELLYQMIELNASDLHLNHNTKITFRLDGKIKKIGPYIAGDDIFGLLLSAQAISEGQQNKYHETGSCDFAYEIDNGVRFRGNLVKARGEYSCVLRRIPNEIIPIEKLGLPATIKKLADSHYGMILMTGPTGSGKSTTLASIIDYINETREIHIATVEEPLEYIHPQKKSLVTQREVGKDTPSFAESMRDVLRRDPDVILVGEMRDYETISSAVTASETGHLVFGTLHTTTAAHTISRITGVYPSGEQDKIRNQLAENLKAVINQRLFPKPGGGRTACYEIMVVNEEMRELIRRGDLNQLQEAMKRARKEGNLLMSDSINYAKQQGMIESHISW